MQRRQKQQKHSQSPEIQGLLRTMKLSSHSPAPQAQEGIPGWNQQVMGKEKEDKRLQARDRKARRGGGSGVPAWCPSGWVSGSPSLTSLPPSPWAILPLMVLPSQEVSWAHQGSGQGSVASFHSWRTAGCSVLITYTHTPGLFPPHPDILKAAIL